MPIYKCEICNINTTIRQHYHRHLNTIKHKNNILEHDNKNKIYGKDPEKTPKDPEKTPKDPEKTTKDPEKTTKDPEKTQKDPEKTQHNSNKFKCEFCDKFFSTYAHKRRHERYRCNDVPLDYKELYKKSEKEKDKLRKEKDELNKDIAEERAEMKEQISQLYDQISRLIDKAGDTTVTNNIILNNYGNEDLSHITEKFKTSLLKIPYASIPKMIEAVHFSDKKPENKNITITNKKDNKVKVYHDGKWIYKNKQDTISDLVLHNYDIIDSHYEDNNEKISGVANSNYLNFQKKIDGQDSNVIKDQLNECELILLNNR